MTDVSIHDMPSRHIAEGEEVIREGDTILIIRANGEVVPMSMSIDEDLLASAQAKEPSEWTKEEAALVKQGQTMFLLSMASQSPVIMNILAEIANAPGVIDLDKIKKVVTLH